MTRRTREWLGLLPVCLAVLFALSACSPAEPVAPLAPPCKPTICDPPTPSPSPTYAVGEVIAEYSNDDFRVVKADENGVLTLPDGTVLACDPVGLVGIAVKDDRAQACVY